MVDVLIGRLEATRAAEAAAIEQAQEVHRIVDDIDLPRFHTAVQTEAEFLLANIDGSSGSLCPVESLKAQADEYAELVRLAGRKTEQRAPA